MRTLNLNMFSRRLSSTHKLLRVIEGPALRQEEVPRAGPAPTSRARRMRRV